MLEFILYSRLGRTDSNWLNLHDAGRLDIAYECTITSLFLSHAIRKPSTNLNIPPDKIFLRGLTSWFKPLHTKHQK